MKDKNILITGGAGFIGSNLAAYFLSQGAKVVVFDNFSTGHKKNLSAFENNDKFVLIDGDIRNLDLIEGVLKKYEIDYVSHQAALGSVPKSINNPILSNDVNVSGTLNILWASHKAGVKKVVCAISSSVYGDAPTLPKIESMPISPLSPYAVTKAACEYYCKVFNDLYGLPTVGLRYFNVYGRNQDPNGDYAAVIPKFILSALHGDPLIIYGNGLQTRDFTYIDDVVSANHLAFSSDKANGKSFNIARGDSINITDLANKVLQYSGSSSKIVYKDPRGGDIQDSVASVELARDVLSFSPKWPLDEGLQATVDWFGDSTL